MFLFFGQMKQMMNETKKKKKKPVAVSKMEANEQFILKDLYFFSFDYIYLLINKTKAFFLSDYSKNQ